VNAAIYRDIAMALKAGGSKVVLDTSGEALRYAIEAAPNIIKPNIHELEALVDKRLQSEAEVIEAAKKLIEQGIELVVVSMGKDGLFCYGDGRRHCTPAGNRSQKHRWSRGRDGRRHYRRSSS
jgi:fructose-1-phosphate kinase PfkB-like protein